MYSKKIEEAILFAALKHRSQFRVGSEPIPYLSHLFSVALIVSEYSESEAAIISALLHDILEDTHTTAEELEVRFGKEVRAIVESLTEPRLPEWKARKLAYLQQLKTASSEALIIAVADKIHNIQSKIRMLSEEGNKAHSRFSVPPSEYVWYHNEVYTTVASRLTSPIVSLYKESIELQKTRFKVSSDSL